MNLLETFKNLWSNFWTYEISEERQRDFYRVELRMLYDRVAYLEDKLGPSDTEKMENWLAETERRLQLDWSIQEAYRIQCKLHEKRRNPSQLTPEEQLEKDQWIADLTPRSKCKHLKGALVSRWGVDRYGGNRLGPAKDYNLARHRFIDFRERIWCLNGCGFESWTGDVNWQKALDMWQYTSNTKSASQSVVLDTLLKKGDPQ